MDQSIKFDLDLIHRYDKAGPRYTSYPTALELHEGFVDKDYREHIALSNKTGGPLSLYFHIPFCDTVCFIAPVIKSSQKIENMPNLI